MKPFQENNGAAIHVGRAATVHNPLFYVHATAECLAGTFLLVNCSNSFKLYCGLCTVKAKNVNKNK